MMRLREAVGTQPIKRTLDDAAEFRAFYAAALPQIYGYFFHRCGGRASVAEDLTQETFLAAVVELRRGREVGDPMRWLQGVARHKLVDHYRRGARDERFIGHASELEVVDDASWPDPVAEATRQRAARALELVAPAQRAALVLRHVDGLPVPEVAAALGKSVHATESLIARGKQSFRRAFVEARDD